jgi:hypothetical protein
MKRFIALCVVASALAGAAAAQNSPAPTAQGTVQAAQQIVKLSGKLEVINGMIGLKADGVSYYIPRLRQLVGFVKELQEGASVKLEGYAYPIPSEAGYSVLMVTKLTIGAKDYDFSQDGGFGPFGGKGMRGFGRGGMGGGRWEGPRGGMRGGQRGGGMGGGPRW